MEKILTSRFRSIVYFLFLSVSVFSCSTDDDNNQISSIILPDLTLADTDALLFMLEEEKLARDTYTALSGLWPANQLANIKNSEQSHMNAIIALLNQYDMDFDILPPGEFYDQDLQNFYDQFMIEGAISELNALIIGATIEDLDILDLEDFIIGTENSSLIAVFQNLQCGSRNHLRSFVSGIENRGGVYSPQFINQSVYELIIQSDQEQCN